MAEQKFILTIVAVGLLFANLACSAPLLQLVESGLEYAEVVASKPSVLGDSKISILRIDPKYFSFVLLSSKELAEPAMTAKDWSLKHRLIAAINAGMFLQDGLTNTGLMQNFGHKNNGRLHSRMKAVLAFNPLQPELPPIQILDRTCQDYEKLAPLYQTLIQGIRMVGCSGENVWRKNDQPWSMAALGTDQQGQVLFFFTQSPYTPKDFIDILLSMPLDLHRAMYLDGGREASMYFAAADQEVEKFGVYGTGLGFLWGNSVPWAIPNVIGVKRKEPQMLSATPVAPAPTR